jgi:hypothetical protein
MLTPLAFTLALSLVAQSTGQAHEMAVAPPDVLALVRDALQQRLNANAIPDFDVTRAAKRVPIREEMPLARMRLNETVLPHVDGVQFYLLSTATAQAQADAAREDVIILIVDSPQIRDATATLLLGMDLVLWHDPAHERLKLCCCDHTAEFTKRDNRWVFLRTGNMTCR